MTELKHTKKDCNANSLCLGGPGGLFCGNCGAGSKPAVIKYKVMAYTGTAWLDTLGTYDTFDEAQTALTENYDKFDADVKSESFEESYYYNSVINEVSV